MKIKKIALKSALATASGLALVAGLVSCGPSNTVSDPYAWDEANKKGDLDIYLDYSGTDGITLQKEQFENTVEGVNYVKGDLLPTWKQYQKKLQYKIYDATSYNASNDNDSYTALTTNNFVSETDNTRKIDVFYNSTSNIEKAGAADKLIDLKANLDKLPNFKKFLENNPTIEKQITKSGKIFYTPYFDGYNAIERMFIMDTNIVKAILDTDTDSNAKDTAVATTNAKGLKAYKYQPFMNAEFNYASAPTVKISKNGVAEDFTLNKTTNIIKQQNDAAATATGQSMRKQLRDYVKAVVGEANVGTGKKFEKLSDFYVGEQAAYNADDLIALMRVVKASPELITGDAGTEVQILVPRGAANNRVDNMADFMQIWGVQGFDAEKDMLYFDENGKLNDAASTKATYDALEYLSQIYDEGLILTDFYKTSTLGSTGYLNKYFGKTTDNGGYGFMLYDYSASTGAVNTLEDGVGTANSKRVGTFKDKDVTGVMPILPPLTYWANKTTSDISDDVNDFTNKSLLRYSDSDRAMKSNSWAIPATTDNLEGALAIVDYLYSAEGARYNDFGPELYWNGAADELTYGGETSPVMSAATKAMISKSQTDFWSFMRGYIGSTHGIGYKRSASINYQATNKYAQIGTANIENAIASGAVTLALVDNPVYKNAANKAGFASAVPSSGYASIAKATSDLYAAVTAFWASDKYAAAAAGWTKYITDAAGTYDSNSTATLGKDTNSTNYSYKDVIDQLEARVKNYLYSMANSQGAQYVPDYAKTSN